MKHNKQYRIIQSSIYIIFAVIAIGFTFLKLQVSALSNIYYIGYSGNAIAEQTLQNATNTYYITKDSQGDEIERVRNNLIVGDYSPSMTILTHGIGDNAAIWSNHFYTTKENEHTDDHFAYDSRSLIERLRSLDKANTVVYRAKVSSDQRNFQLFWCDIKNQYEQYGKDIAIDKITDISKHMIIVFEAYHPNGTNQQIYAQLDHVIDKLVYDIAHLNGNILPKINLIGHDRGGITNLQYILEHGDLIDSVFSMGTPYHGSNIATVFQNTLPGGDAIQDIINEDIYKKYMTTWNNHYQTRYSHIQYHAMGGYSSLDFVNDIHFSDNLNSPVWFDILFGLVSFCFKSPLIFAQQELVALILTTISSHEYVDALNGFITEIGYDSILDFFGRIPVLYDDMFVSLESQLGRGKTDYQGFTRFQKRFTKYNCDIEKVSDKDIPIVHNLEARDTEFINYIVSNIPLSKTEIHYFTEEKADGTIKIIGANILDMVNQRLVLPSSIDGKIVTEIGEAAFAHNFYGQNVGWLEIPATVEIIGERAFAESSCLQTINFASNSALQEIRAEAFTNCYQLTNINGQNISNIAVIGDAAFRGCKELLGFAFDDSLTWIGELAFADCYQLYDIYIGPNVTFIGDGAFANIANPGFITVADDNPNYSFQVDALYNKEQTILLQYFNRGNMSFTILDTAQEIASYAFYGAAVSSVDLGQVQTIRDFVFYENTSIMSFEGLENISYIGMNAFLGTSLYEIGMSQDMFEIGKVLMKHNGYSESAYSRGILYQEDFAKYTMIASGAFLNIEDLTKVYLPSSIRTLESAFINCTSLQEVYLLGVNAPFTESLPWIGCATQMIVYVPECLLEELYGNLHWNQYYLNNFDVSIRFDATGGNSSTGIQDTKYYGPLANLPVPTKRGYQFIGWYDENAICYSNGSLWNHFEETTLYAHWTPITYYVNYQLNGGTNHPKNPTTYHFNQTSIALFHPTKPGYLFAGWFINANLSGNALDSFHPQDYENITLYAKWVEGDYLVTLDVHANADPSATVYPDQVSIGYGNQFTLPVPSRTGYIFNGWCFLPNVMYTDSEGHSIRPWDQADQTTLYANWTPERYYIRTDIDHQSYWFGALGWSEAETSIDFGTFFQINNYIYVSFGDIISKVGHRFTYFTLGETRFDGIGHTIPKLTEDGTTIVLTPQWQVEEHSIVFDSNGGSAIATISAAYLADISQFFDQPNHPKRTGYTFSKWVIKEFCSYSEYAKPGDHAIQVGDIFYAVDFDHQYKMPDVTGDVQQNGYMILQAVWEPNVYAVFFDSAGGSQMANAFVSYGIYNTLAVPIKLGYDFKGWYSGSNGTGEQYTDALGQGVQAWEKTNIITLYAKWEVHTYQVYYEMFGGINDTRNPQTYTIEQIHSLYNSIKNEHRFMWWYINQDKNQLIDELNGSLLSSTVIQNNTITIYGHYEKLYTLKFEFTAYSHLTNKNETIIKYLEGIYGEYVNLPSCVIGGYAVRYWNSASYLPNDRYCITTSRDFIGQQRIASLAETNNHIYFIEQLNEMRDLANQSPTALKGVIFKLNNHIYLPSDWTLIHTFYGELDGMKMDGSGYYNIMGLKIVIKQDDTDSRYGFIRDNRGLIGHIVFDDVSITSNFTSTANNSDIKYIGAIAGYNEGNIYYCDVLGSINIRICRSYVGGITGYNHGMVTDIHQGIHITGYGDIGGVAGKNDRILTDCMNYGVIALDIQIVSGDAYNRAAGGIVSYNVGATVSRCTNSGAVVYISPKSENTTIQPYIGHIIGCNEGPISQVQNCTFNGTVDQGTLHIVKKLFSQYDQAKYVCAYAGGAIGFNV